MCKLNGKFNSDVGLTTPEPMDNLGIVNMEQLETWWDIIGSIVY